MTPLSSRSLFLLSVLALTARAFSPQHQHAPRPTSALHATFQGTIVACTGPTCTRKGGKQSLAYLQELAAGLDGVTVETMNCVSECAECGLGPNMELRAEGKKGPFFPIKNKITTQAQVRELLGLAAEEAEAAVEEEKREQES